MVGSSASIHCEIEEGVGPSATFLFDYLAEVGAGLGGALLPPARPQTW